MTHERKKSEKVIAFVKAVRRALSDLGFPQVSQFTDDEVGQAALLDDLGMEEYELVEFLDRVEEYTSMHLDKDTIIDFIHRGYVVTVYEIAKINSKHSYA